jgi:hypothetical protein
VSEILGPRIALDRLTAFGTPPDFPTWEDKVAAYCSDHDRFGYLRAEILADAIMAPEGATAAFTTACLAWYQGAATRLADRQT